MTDLTTIDDVERVVLGGIETGRIDRASMAAVLVRECVERRSASMLPRVVFSSNGFAIAMAGRDQAFAKVLRQADLVHADGMSVILASRLLFSQPLPERVPTTDFFHDAARAGQAHRLRFYMLGGREDINAKAFARARQLYPNIEWVGRHHGYFAEDEEAEICRQIVEAKTDVLWLALGRPHQEYFAIRNRERLRNVGWIKTCGGLFDFLAGAHKRAPLWMQKYCLEWLWRMMLEPRRLIWRYTKTNVLASWYLATRSRASAGRREVQPAQFA